MNKIEEKWRYVFEENLPSEAATWGRKGNMFSMRLAIQQAEDALQAKLSTVV
jgi:hypothetical protein